MRPSGGRDRVHITPAEVADGQLVIGLTTSQGGPRVDLENRRLPHRRIQLWQSYRMDFALIVLMALYPPTFVRRFVKEPDTGVLEAASDIRPDFAFRCNPMFVQQIPPHLRDTVVQRMTTTDIEMYGNADWVEYEKLRRILASH